MILLADPSQAFYLTGKCLLGQCQYEVRGQTLESVDYRLTACGMSELLSIRLQRGIQQVENLEVWIV